jgi:AraC-like DNA-binding protein
MKVLQFTVPIIQDGSIVVQEDILPYFYNYFHRHTEAQITLISKGAGTLIAGNYTQPFKAGEVYILGANQPHIFRAEPKYFEHPKAGSIHAIHIYLNLELFSNTIFKLPEFNQIRKFVRTTHNGFQLPEKFVREAAKKIKKIRSTTGLERLQKFIWLLNFFSTEVKEWKSLSTGFSRNELTDTEGMRINDIYQYTIDHYADKISLKKVAEVAHITPHAFCKYFKKHTRKTYMGFLNEIRINEACKKIIAGNFDSIATVGYSVGFNNTITFNRVFKKITGITPTEYINKYKRR